MTKWGVKIERGRELANSPQKLSIYLPFWWEVEGVFHHLLILGVYIMATSVCFYVLLFAHLISFWNIRKNKYRKWLFVRWIDEPAIKEGGSRELQIGKINFTWSMWKLERNLCKNFNIFAETTFWEELKLRVKIMLIWSKSNWTQFGDFRKWNQSLSYIRIVEY